MSPLRALPLLLLLLAPAVLAAAEDASGPAWGTTSSALVRPGSRIDFGDGQWCTAGYALQRGAQAFLVTAGHCVGDGGRLVHPDVYAGTTPIGRVVAYPQHPSHPDVALIEVTDASRVNATVLGWGGPRGTATDADLAPGALARQLGIYGQNATWAALGKRMRTGDLLGADGTEYWSNTPVGKGDSGAPVLRQDGRLAVGIHSRTPTDAVASELGVRLDAALAFFARDPAYAGLELALG